MAGLGRLIDNRLLAVHPVAAFRFPMPKGIEIGPTWIVKVRDRDVGCCADGVVEYSGFSCLRLQCCRSDRRRYGVQSGKYDHHGDDSYYLSSVDGLLP